jgi:Calponin homology (CH) domain
VVFRATKGLQETYYYYINCNNNHLLQVFTNWVNLHLNKRGLELKDLQNDFSNGEMLCALMEELSGKKITDILSHATNSTLPPLFSPYTLS